MGLLPAAELKQAPKLAIVINCHVQINARGQQTGMTGGDSHLGRGENISWTSELLTTSVYPHVAVDDDWEVGRLFEFRGSVEHQS